MAFLLRNAIRSIRIQSTLIPLKPSYQSAARCMGTKRHKSKPVKPSRGLEDDGDDRTPEEVLFLLPLLVFIQPIPILSLCLPKVVASIDTTLTAEQQAYVNALKHKMKGAGKKSPYRDVPSPAELAAHNYAFPPFVPPNAEALIDWALSHVPKRDGPRGSRLKKRMAARFAFRNVFYH